MVSLFNSTLTGSLFTDLDSTLTLKRYPVIASGIDENVVNFAATPSTVSTHACNVQIYNRQAAIGVNAQNYGGLTAKEGRYEIICEPMGVVNPETDVIEVTNGITALVKVVVWNDASHTHLIVDER